MDVRNLATAALLDTLKKYDINQEEILDGTGLQLSYIHQTNKSLHWNQFITMYENCANLIGSEQAVRDIGHTGIYNDKISHIRKFGTGLLDAKTIYWGISTFLAKHLFKECVIIDYKKIDHKNIQMEISIHQDLQDCPLLLETYTHVFENIPTVLGLSKAKVATQILKNKGIYSIELNDTSFFKFLYNKIRQAIKGQHNALLLMSELELQKHKLEQLLEDKSQLLRILSHDITNQVESINFNLTKVLRSDSLKLEERKQIEDAKLSTAKLKNVLNNVQRLELSHFNGLIIEPVDINPIFYSLKNTFKDLLSQKNIGLVIQNDLPSHSFVLAEAYSLETHILGNLLSNAIKFSPENASIILDASLVNDKIFISIRDRGAGIHHKNINQLLSKKIKPSATGTKLEKGTGFGLGIVNNYLNLHDGRLTYHNNYPTGSIFTIELNKAVPDLNVSQNYLSENLSVSNLHN